jgi:hypothetical protein
VAMSLARADAPCIVLLRDTIRFLQSLPRTR